MKVKYYIQDELADESNLEPTFSEFKTKEGFLESLKYNHDIALEYGDCVEKLDDILKKIKNETNCDVHLNAFTYIKLTDTSLEDYLGLSKEDIGTIEKIN